MINNNENQKTRNYKSNTIITNMDGYEHDALILHNLPTKAMLSINLNYVMSCQITFP